MQNKLYFGARILLGLIYTVFGLNGFFQFLPMPPLPEQAGAFLGALAATGYMFPLIKATEVIGGIALLAGCYVPLALIILAPITVNIFLFHLVLTPGLQNSIMPVVMIVLQILVAKSCWGKFQGLFKAKCEGKCSK